MDDQTISGQGSPGGLTPQGLPNVGQYGIPTAGNFLPKNGEHQQKPHNVREIYNELVKKGAHPVDAAKQAQAMTGMSVVTGRPIQRRIKFSKKNSKVIGQYGTSGKSRKFGMYG